MLMHTDTRCFIVSELGLCSFRLILTVLPFNSPEGNTVILTLAPLGPDGPGGPMGPVKP